MGSVTQTKNPGISPDAEAIYNQYVSYYTDMNSKIYAIDQLDPSKRSQPNVVTDRATILSSQTQMGPVYQTDYANSNATLASFQTDCAPIIAKVTAAYNNAMGGNSPIAQQISQDYTTAQIMTASMTSSLNQDQNTLNSALNSLSGFQSTLTALQVQINAMPPGPSRDKAQNDLTSALIAFGSLTSATTNATSQLSIVQSNLIQITLPTNGVLALLQNLAALSNPQQSDLTLANQLLGIVQNGAIALQTFESGPLAVVNANIGTLSAAIAAVQNDIQPAPTPGKIEHSCWYIDWTSWDFPIPQGVNTVNLFVGEIALVNGQPTITGFGNMGLDKLQDFVSRCAANNPPISVKVSIGGGGGSYDNCWDLITSPEVAATFAQGMVNFCHQYKLAGVDFDYEEFRSAGQEKLVGTLIKNFKALDPNLQASLCTNAGLGWESDIKNILDATVDPVTGKCPLDRLYIMSYYDSLDQEKQWISSWADWLKQNYNLNPSQVTVGIDDFDAHAYDIGAFSSWAATQGFSTAYWAWNPATPDGSNQSALKILNSYNSSKLSTFSRILVWIISYFSYILATMLESWLLTPSKTPALKLETQPKRNRHLPEPNYPPPPYDFPSPSAPPPF